jgi:CheY-like chemotaxis protein
MGEPAAWRTLRWRSFRPRHAWHRSPRLRFGCASQQRCENFVSSGGNPVTIGNDSRSPGVIWPMHRILLFEDDPLARQALADMIEDNGHSVVCGRLDAEALLQVQTEQFDVVLTDMQMPRFSGIDVLRWVNRYRPDKPVIGLSGSGPRRMAELGVRQAEFTAFLPKPVSREVLLRRIEQTVAPNDVL